jgi:hypothetical protein
MSAPNVGTSSWIVEHSPEGSLRGQPPVSPAAHWIDPHGSWTLVLEKFHFCVGLAIAMLSGSSRDSIYPWMYKAYLVSPYPVPGYRLANKHYTFPPGDHGSPIVDLQGGPLWCPPCFVVSWE